MRIKMITTMAGPDGVRQAGKVYEVENELAATLLKGGFAEPVPERKQTAEIKPKERAVGRGQKKEALDVAENPES